MEQGESKIEVFPMESHVWQVKESQKHLEPIPREEGNVVVYKLPSFVVYELMPNCMTLLQSP